MSPGARTKPSARPAARMCWPSAPNRKKRWPRPKISSRKVRRPSLKSPPRKNRRKPEASYPIKCKNPALASRGFLSSLQRFAQLVQQIAGAVFARTGIVIAVQEIAIFGQDKFGALSFRLQLQRGLAHRNPPPRYLHHTAIDDALILDD